jgi:hypothetical protein
LALALTGLRIVSSTGMIGANDRSRWLHMAALAETGDHSIGRRVRLPDGTWHDEGKFTDPAWESVDIVLNPKTQKFYSSKPALWAMAVFPVYRIFHDGIPGRQVADYQRMARWTTAVVNLPLIFLFAWVVVLLSQRLTHTWRGQILVVWVGLFSTFITPFGSTLTNHLPAACFAGLGTLMLLMVLEEKSESRGMHLGLGFAWGMVSALELPAVALTGLVFLALLQRQHRTGALLFLAGVAMPLLVFVGANQMAYQNIFPPWVAGEKSWFQFEGGFFAKPHQGANKGIWHAFGYSWNFLFGHHGIFLMTPLLLFPIWIGIGGPRRSRLVNLAFFIVVTSLVRWSWRNSFYEYLYGFRVPLFLGLFSVWGAWVFARTTKAPDSWSTENTLVRIFLGSSLTVAAFYFLRTSSFGGAAVGPRWFLWLIPLWLALFAHRADGLLEGKWTRRAVLVATAVSAFFALGSGPHPWLDPLPFSFVEAL